MPALAQSGDAVQLARQLLAANRAEEAYAQLAPLANDRAGDPEFDLLLGIAAIDSGREGEAIVALQRVLAVQPNNSRAKAELGRAYAMAGDIDTARRELRTVLNDPTVPDPVRRRIDGLVNDFDRAAGEGGVELTGYFDAEVGLDSNINTATDVTSITLPAFAFLGPATLNGAAREQDDGYYQVQGGISLSAPLSRQVRLFGSALGNWRDNFNNDFVDQAAALGSAGLAYSMANGDTVSVAGQVQRFWLDQDGYRTTVGGVVQYTKRLSDSSALSVAGQYYRLNYDGQPLLDADRFSGSVTYSDRNLFAGIGGGKEETVRSGVDHLGYIFFDGQVGGEYPIDENAAVIGGISAEYRDYDDQDPLFLDGREDFQVDLSLGMRVQITDNLSARPRVTYTVNESNFALYDYQRFTASMGLRFDF